MEVHKFEKFLFAASLFYLATFSVVGAQSITAASPTTTSAGKTDAPKESLWDLPVLFLRSDEKLEWGVETRAVCGTLTQAEGNTLHWMNKGNHCQLLPHHSADVKPLKGTPIGRSQSDLAPLVNEIKKKTGDTKRLVVYVHGAYIPGRYQVTEAAEIAAAMKSPVVLFSWHSYKRFYEFQEWAERGNASNVEKAKTDFKTFIQALQTNLPGIDIILVMHGMGCRLIDAAPTNDQSPFAYTVLAASDTLLHRNEIWERAGQISKFAWILVNPFDDVLLPQSPLLSLIRRDSVIAGPQLIVGNQEAKLGRATPDDIYNLTDNRITKANKNLLFLDYREINDDSNACPYSVIADLMNDTNNPKQPPPATSKNIPVMQKYFADWQTQAISSFEAFSGNVFTYCGKRRWKVCKRDTGILNAWARSTPEKGEAPPPPVQPHPCTTN